MLPQLVSADYVAAHAVRLRFADGDRGRVGSLGRALGRGLRAFRRFRLDRELNTLICPTTADLAPELLYERTRGHG